MRSCTDSLTVSSASREACSITRATAPRSRGRSLAFLGHCPEHPGEQESVAVGPVNVFGEIDRHFEQLAEIGIERAEQVIEHTVADQDDLDVERDRLRFERDRTDQS